MSPRTPSPPDAIRLDAKWLASPVAVAVARMLEDGGHQALFVGGCVRNTLLGAPVTDLDMATDAVPERVIALAEAAGLRAVPTGIEHGTVTLVHDDGVVEVTTFRADRETDGRRATVRFSRDVTEDAARRDFTMNALYCDARGVVRDPVGTGLADLRAGILRFVGDPSRRVREDYLRILRFFRFFAWYADPVGGPDPDALAACAEGAGGLERVSAERIGAEMRKLLAAPDPAPALATMAQSGVLARVLPGADAGAVARFVALAPEVQDPIARLAALGGIEVSDRLRLSRAEERQRSALRDAATGTAPPAELAWRMGRQMAHAAVALRQALLEQPLPADLDADLDRGAAATFPLTAQDLMPAYRGAALGERLRQLEAAWIASEFTARADDLMALPDPPVG